MPSPSRSRRPRTCRSRRTPSGTCRPHLHGKMPSPVGSASEGHGGIGRTGPQRWRLVGPDAAFAARGPPAHALRISATTVVVTFRGHSSRRTRLTRLATPALAVLLGAACASTDPTPAAGTRPLTPASSATTSAQPTSEEAPVTTVRISLGDRTFMAQLADNPTARDLVDQLPLTLRFRDFNRVEKIAELPRPLTMDGVPAGADPEINDIGYYAPSGDVVLYYGDVGYFTGIVRVGRLDAEDMSSIEPLPDGFELLIDRG